MMWVRWAVLAWLVLCGVVLARPPRCGEWCLALTGAESGVGEYHYAVSSLENNIVINIYNNTFVLKCQHQDVDPAALPRYEPPVAFAVVVLEACGAAGGLADLLNRLGLHTARLQLDAWRGDLAPPALAGLELASLQAATPRGRPGAVYAAALRGVAGLEALTLRGGGLVGAEGGVGAGLLRLELSGVQGAGSLSAPASLLHAVVRAGADGAGPSLAAATGLRSLLLERVETVELPSRAPSLASLTLVRAGAAPRDLAAWAPVLTTLVMLGGCAPALEGVSPSVLRLSSQGLRSVPGPVPALRSLRELDLSDNALESLPALRLPLLTRLVLDHNRIQTIPNLSACVSLQEVRLADNLVTSLPAPALLPPSFARLALSGNPLAASAGVPLPASVRVELSAATCAGAVPAGVRAAYCGGRPCARRERADGVTELACARWPAAGEWPGGRVALRVESAGLTELSEWPAGLRELYVRDNALSSLPAAPTDTLDVLDARDNPLSAAAAPALLAAGTAHLTCRCDALLARLGAARAPEGRVRCDGGEEVAGRRRACGWGAAAGVAAAGAAGAALAAGAVALYYRFRLTLKRALHRYVPRGRRGDKPALDVAVVGDGALAGAVLAAARGAGLRAAAVSEGAPGAFGPAAAGAVLRAASTHVLLDAASGDAQMSLALCGRSPAHRSVVVLPASIAPARAARGSRARTYLREDDPRFWDKLLAAVSAPGAPAARAELVLSPAALGPA